MYYVFDNDGGPCRWIQKYPRIKGLWWDDGARFRQELSDPIEITLKPFNPNSWDHSQEMPEFFNGTIPVMRDDLIDALHRCGVDNLDLYNVKLIDPDDGTIHINYKAVNIIGLIAAADMEKSKATVHNNIPLIDVEFDELVIDESKTFGTLMFRMAENTSAILVHQKIKDFLIKEGFTKLEFYKLDEVAI